MESADAGVWRDRVTSDAVEARSNIKKGGISAGMTRGDREAGQSGCSEWDVRPTLGIDPGV